MSGGNIDIDGGKLNVIIEDIGSFFLAESDVEITIELSFSVYREVKSN